MITIFDLQIKLIKRMLKNPTHPLVDPLISRTFFFPLGKINNMMINLLPVGDLVHVVSCRGAQTLLYGCSCDSVLMLHTINPKDFHQI